MEKKVEKRKAGRKPLPVPNGFAIYARISNEYEDLFEKAKHHLIKDYPGLEIHEMTHGKTIGLLIKYYLDSKN